MGKSVGSGMERHAQSFIDDDEQIATVREEGTSKNPIRIRLHADRERMNPDHLTGMVAKGRDFFHSFMAQTVRRRYRRSPIYLVDAWLPEVLGLFTREHGAGLPSPDSLRAGAEAFPAIEGFEPVVALFHAVEAVNEHLAGVRLLQVAEVAGDLEAAAVRLVATPRDNTTPSEQLWLLGASPERGPGARSKEIDEIDRQCRAVEQLVDRAVSVLHDDEMLRPHVDLRFAKDLEKRLETLMDAARDVVRSEPPEIPGISFEPGRGSGVLFGSIKELDIEGPAVLLAPRSIRKWARETLDDYVRVHPISLQGRTEWFGARSDEDLLFSFALGNVLQHELTHAMLALPNDPGQDVVEMNGQRDAFYQKRPDFEEGLANFTAAVCSTMQMMKAQRDVRGANLPMLHKGVYHDLLGDYEGFMRATYQAYHTESTDVFLQAWRANKLDYRAFAGILHMYATNSGSSIGPGSSRGSRGASSGRAGDHEPKGFHANWNAI